MKISAVFCDAGSSNLLAHFLKKRKIKFDCYATGASLKILKKIFPGKKIYKKINSNILKSKTLITTTSLNNFFEFQAKNLCKNKDIKIVSIIDNWINYKMRFVYKKKLILPDEIWVFDKFAFRKSKKIFKKTKIIQKRNFYLEEISKKIKLYKNKNYILYICERNKIIKNVYEYEYKNIKKIILKFKKYFSERSLLHIKLHPNSLDKLSYKKVMKHFPKIKYKILNNTPIEKALSSAKIVVGLRSYALYISVMNSLKTYTIASRKIINNYVPYKINKL